MNFTTYRGYRIRLTGLTDSTRAFCVELQEQFLGRYLRLKYVETKEAAKQWVDHRLVPGWDANGSPVE